jgi:murein L,D-transpeptidase YcbB/YkuD
MQETVALVLDSGDHFGMVVADIHANQARVEVNEFVPVHILYDTALG